MTKHFCDRCGREHHRLFKVGVTCCLYEFAPELGPYSDDGPQSGRWDTELCPDCLAWLKANWPFKGNWMHLDPTVSTGAHHPSSVTKTLTPKEWQQATPTTPLPDSGSNEGPPVETTIAGTTEDLSLVDLSPQPFVVGVHIDGNHLSVKTPLASWEIDLTASNKEARS